MRAVLQPVLGEHGGERAEGVRLDDIDADVEERRVQSFTMSGRVRVRMSLQPSFAGPPKSSSDGSRRLEVRAERAVEDDDALVHRVQERHPAQATGARVRSLGLLSTSPRLRGG